MFKSQNIFVLVLSLLSFFLSPEYHPFPRSAQAYASISQNSNLFSPFAPYLTNILRAFAHPYVVTVQQMLFEALWGVVQIPGEASGAYGASDIISTSEQIDPDCRVARVADFLLGRILFMGLAGRDHDQPQIQPACELQYS
ncbi:hypothetical protein L873DRAFT_1786063 [Choiromyces venosus 120613-1]|uniref:Uncharacterized protein n=1 Tax=Choiromyces venosus 120613-1 TaxID=1336337 RepID=A0A3N4KG96_9PEZI|nr:hypothetical protein L873DRAFT_1786063 [Choiromyces venosus 120613-1]